MDAETSGFSTQLLLRIAAGATGAFGIATLSACWGAYGGIFSSILIIPAATIILYHTNIAILQRTPIQRFMLWLKVSAALCVVDMLACFVSFIANVAVAATRVSAMNYCFRAFSSSSARCNQYNTAAYAAINSACIADAVFQVILGAGAALVCLLCLRRMWELKKEVDRCPDAEAASSTTELRLMRLSPAQQKELEMANEAKLARQLAREKKKEEEEMRQLAREKKKEEEEMRQKFVIKFQPPWMAQAQYKNLVMAQNPWFQQQELLQQQQYQFQLQQHQLQVQMQMAGGGGAFPPPPLPLPAPLATTTVLPPSLLLMISHQFMMMPPPHSRGRSQSQLV